MKKTQLLKKIRIILILFILSLIVSGITAFPIESELQFLNQYNSMYPELIKNWLSEIYIAVKTTNENFPYLSYGTDWLAFAHIILAIFFIGPLINPVKNIFIIQSGIIACILVFPLAFIAGNIRQIPFFWQLIDCSFGLFGAIPLIWCYYLTRKLEKIS